MTAASRYTDQAMGRKIVVRFLTDVAIFFVATGSKPVLPPSSNLLFNGYRGNLPGDKGAGCEAHSLPPSAVNVKNARNYTACPP
jgi:hypothetical protein